MSQHDYVIANAAGATVRTDLNSVLQAIVTNNSSATEPTTTYPNMWWFDTSTSLLKRRNNANTAWITLGLEAVDTDGTLAANSDTKIASQKATKTYADTKMSKTGAETIAGVKTFSSFPVTPSAAPTSNYQAANKKFVDDAAALKANSSHSHTASEVGSLFGTRASKNNNTSYLAEADGFFTVRNDGNGAVDPDIAIYTDASNPPTTLILQAEGEQSDDACSLTCPVIKGEYYKAVCTTGGLLSLSWLPMGS